MDGIYQIDTLATPTNFVKYHSITENFKSINQTFGLFKTNFIFTHSILITKLWAKKIKTSVVTAGEGRLYNKRFVNKI